MSVNEHGPAHNQDKLLRTLLGLLLHPNAGAVLVLQTAEDTAAAVRGEGIAFEALRAAAVAEGRAAELESLAPQVAIPDATPRAVVPMPSLTLTARRCFHMAQ